jgi:hypothetical protein
MKLTWEYEAAADAEYQNRVYLEAQEALDAKEAADAIDYDALGIAEPLAIAVNGWLASQRVAIAPRIAPRGYAMIGNGLFVRVGNGKKRKAA